MKTQVFQGKQFSFPVVFRRSFEFLLGLCICTFAIRFFTVEAREAETKFEGRTYSPEGYRLSIPGYPYEFPKDHAAHPEFRTEWWYFTGHLNRKNESRTSYGFELTFFRAALGIKASVPESRWGLRDLYFAHFAISDLDKGKFWFSEKASRGAMNLAGASEERLNVWIENWFLKIEDDQKWRLHVSQDDHELDLILKPSKKEVIHGNQGVSQKAEGAGKASHYVSFTRMDTLGKLKIRGNDYEVKGETWFDHEFGSNQLSTEQVGWDWFSLQLDSGEELMIYLLRKENGCFETTSSGTWIDAQGKSTHLAIDDLSVLSKSTWKSPSTGTIYPSSWDIRIPKMKLEVHIKPLLSNQELILKETGKMAYWEGACSVSGTHSGRAYVELTGYDHQLGRSPLSGQNNF